MLKKIISGMDELFIRQYNAADYDILLSFSTSQSLENIRLYGEDKTFVIFKEHEVIGWYVLALAKEKVQSGFIFIFVKPEFRCNGVASCVYLAVEPLIKETSNSWWTSYQSSEEADQFCRKMKFGEIHVNNLLEYHGEYIDDDFSNIRKYRDSDFKKASSIWITEYRDMQKSIGHDSDVQIPDEVLERSIYSKCSEFIYVVEKENEVIGVGQVFEDYSGIGNLAIDSQFQHYGYGRKLLAYLINECIRHGSKNPLIYCEAENVNALRLYLKTGFRIIKSENYTIKQG